MKPQIRTAFFADSYNEINGVSTTARRLTSYAGRNGLPFLCVHAGPTTAEWDKDGVSFLGLKRSPLSFALDEGLAYDPLFQRHVGRVKRRLQEFQPDIIHITGLNDVSIIGTFLAWKLQIPLIGAWHTNLHEFAGTRLNKTLRFLPGGAGRSVAAFAERNILRGALQYYRIPKVLLAPNPDLISILSEGTGRPTRSMLRGVDTEFFSPDKRTINDGKLRLGSVGRLRVEKNVRLLLDLDKNLREAGLTGYEFLIVGEGDERQDLEKRLSNAVFTGFLEGEKLAEAYANMDIFLFPSETDTFGNVAQEANASGVPAIVSDRGGPKFIIRHGETGFVAKDLEEFTRYTIQLMENRELLSDMKKRSREFALTRSWDSVFDEVYEAYREAIQLTEAGRANYEGKEQA